MTLTSMHALDAAAQIGVPKAAKSIRWTALSVAPVVLMRLSWYSHQAWEWRVRLDCRDKLCSRGHLHSYLARLRKPATRLPVFHKGMVDI